MADKTTEADKKHQEPKSPFDANHPDHPNYKGDAPQGVINAQRSAEPPIAPPVTKGHEHPTEKELHAHDHGSINAEQNQLVEQQLKTQQREQYNREAFPKGLAQEHGKGNS